MRRPTPAYYKGKTGMEPFDVVREFSLGFLRGTGVAYLLRAGRKGDAREDLLKARDCIDRELEEMDFAEKSK